MSPDSVNTKAVSPPRLTSRQQQALETKVLILDAALEAFAELGFDSVSTYEVARIAGLSQGLVSYHYKTKAEMWRGVTKYLFGKLQDYMDVHLPRCRSREKLQQGRHWIKTFVRFSAENPALVRFMLEVSKHPDKQLDWMVETYVKPFYDTFLGFFDHLPSEHAPHGFYMFVGASTLPFACSEECLRLTGVDLKRRMSVTTHADYVADLFLPLQAS